MSVKKSKKTKQRNANIISDFEGVALEGEAECEVPVYSSSDEIRRKIREYLSTELSKAQFAREISKSLGTEGTISRNSLTDFLKSGPAAGKTSTVFYGSYVLFEKIRIRDGKPKTEHRLGMED